MVGALEGSLCWPVLQGWECPGSPGQRVHQEEQFFSGGALDGHWHTWLKGWTWGPCTQGEPRAVRFCPAPGGPARLPCWGPLWQCARP